MNSRLAVLGVGAGLGAMLLATGCSSSSSGGAVTPGSPSASSSPQPTASSPSPTDTATASPSPTATVTSPVAARPCTSAHLVLSLGSSQGAAGSIYQPIVFTNTGHHACTLFGYPGVSFVNGSGTQLGVPARHGPGKTTTIKLAPRGQASANLQQPNPGNFAPSACHQATATQLKVYPPNQRAPLYVADNVKVCTTTAGRTTVMPVVFGSGQ